VRSVLLDSRTHGLDAMAELALMFASRAQQIAEVIAPNVEAGRWVLCDRYTDSSEAYQGGGRQLGSATILDLHRVVCRGLQPELTVLMDSDVGASVARARRRNAQARGEAEEAPDENRFEQESRAFFERVHEAYDRIAAREPERVFKVDARRKMDVVHQDIVEEVRKKFRI
jgi:dTMP kinase